MKMKFRWLIPILAVGLAMSATGCKNGEVPNLNDLASNLPAAAQSLAADPMGAANDIIDGVPNAINGVLDSAADALQGDGSAAETTAPADEVPVQTTTYGAPSFDIYGGYGPSGIEGALNGTQPATTTAAPTDNMPKVVNGTDDRGFDVPPSGSYHDRTPIEFDINPDGSINNHQGTTADTTQTPQESTPVEKPTGLPVFDGQPFVTINNNVPYFPANILDITDPYEVYSELDSLGRCGAAFANVCKELMPTTDRESIGSVKPSGWQNAKYDNIDGKYLYNRCHLIGYQLAGENANPRNLITGTRYLNIKGMLPFENWVDDYVDETGNHVLYRVTPVYEGNNLVASGVLMEGYSVEDKGEGIMFCVYCFNVQPGIIINYSDGSSYAYVDGTATLPDEDESDTVDNSDEEYDGYYVLNTHTMKFHKSTCPLCDSIAENNREAYLGDREDCIEDGYTPCGRCNP